MADNEKKDNFELNTIELSALNLKDFDIKTTNDINNSRFDIESDVKDFTQEIDVKDLRMFDDANEINDNTSYSKSANENKTTNAAADSADESKTNNATADNSDKTDTDKPDDDVSVGLNDNGYYLIDEDKESDEPETKKGHVKKKRRRKKANKKHIPIIVLIILIIATLAAVLIYRILNANPVIEEDVSALMEDIESAIAPSEDGDTAQGIDDTSDDTMGSAVTGHILAAARAVETAYGKRPPTIPLTDENRDTFVNIENCVIDTETGQVRVDMTSEGIPKSDDKYYYLFALNSFSGGIVEQDEYITRIYKDEEATMSCALNANSSSTRLYKKFGIAVKENGEYTLISTPQYITNPEAIARYGGVYMTPASKKGILIDYTRVNSGQLEDLGVKQAAINLHIASLLGPTSNALQPTVYYTYNGKTYSFNGAVLEGFDATIRALNAKGISVTAILLNTYSSSYISLIHPNARSAGACEYYMFNAADQAGVEILSAVGSFLASRYSGSTYGRISNWVIANEVNARKEWNYMSYTDVNTYTAAYADAFRVFYNAIKSTSSSARVYISLDQQWDRNLSNNPDYDGRDVLDSFNNYISAHGNINWGLAYHPYNVPLTTCRTWASSKYVSHSASTSMISMQNIEVLINYMNQSHFLEEDGDVRSIMLTELGYTSSGNGTEQLQAAAIAYAYYKVNYYNDIDGLLLNRQTDSSVEIAQGLATGITTVDGGHKLSYNVFKYMDTDKREEYTEFAKSIIGISSWSQILY